jgi:hypothetical protein
MSCNKSDGDDCKGGEVSRDGFTAGCYSSEELDLLALKVYQLLRQELVRERERMRWRNTGQL